jgi:hypothetical protein
VRRHGILALAASVLFLTGLTAQPASAQRPGWRHFSRPRMAYAAQRARENNAGQPRGQANVRGLASLPPKWVSRLRDMPPDEQERFMQNNQLFQRLPPERQQQIRQNLEKWNNLSPEQKQAAREREQVLERLTPEQRQYLRNTLLPQWQAMPQDRRQAINRHLAMLRNMSPATQEAALNDPRFMQGLSPDEQSMLRSLNSLRNPPSQ